MISARLATIESIGDIEGDSGQQIMDSGLPSKTLLALPERTTMQCRRISMQAQAHARRISTLLRLQHRYTDFAKLMTSAHGPGMHMEGIKVIVQPPARLMW